MVSLLCFFCSPSLFCDILPILDFVTAVTAQSDSRLLKTLEKKFGDPPKTVLDLLKDATGSDPAYLDSVTQEFLESSGVPPAVATSIVKALNGTIHYSKHLFHAVQHRTTPTPLISSAYQALLHSLEYEMTSERKSDPVKVSEDQAKFGNGTLTSYPPNALNINTIGSPRREV
jgi:hypothetical protein